MTVNSRELFTRINPTTRFGIIFQFPVTRIFIAIVFLAPVSILSALIGPELFSALPEPLYTIAAYARDIGFLIMFILMYQLYVRIVEKREPYEFTGKKAFGEFLIGCLLSIAIVCFMVGLMAAFGFYKIDDINSANIIVKGIFKYGMAAFAEELIFRVIIFKLVEEYFGSWIAVVVQGIIFGIMHTMNPNATATTTFLMIISTMFMFGGGYMLTRRIWFIWGLHVTWNLFQEGIFGMPNSGYSRPGFLKPVITGPEWITGGAWGIEASLIANALLIMLGYLIFKRALNKGQLVLPSWKRVQSGAGL